MKRPLFLAGITDSPYRFFNLLSVIFLAAMFVYAAVNPGYLHCSFKAAYGFDCPSCGMTRAFRSILHGSFSEAITYHSGVFWVFGFFFLQAVMRLAGFVPRFDKKPIIAGDIIVSLILLILCFGKGYGVL